MNKFLKTIIFLISSIIGNNVFAQVDIFITANDFTNQTNIKTFDRFRFLTSNKHFVLIDSNEKKVKILKDTTWGYRIIDEYEKQHLYRVVKKQVFEIDKIHNKIIIYIIKQNENLVNESAFQINDLITYYFSKTLNDKPQLLNYKNIISNYDTLSQNQIDNLKQIKNLNILNKKNKKTKNYYIIDKVFTD